MKRNFIMLLIFCLAIAMTGPAFAQDDRPTQILLTNVNVWDGTSDGLAMGQSVLVEGNLIKEVGAGINAGGALHWLKEPVSAPRELRSHPRAGNTE